MLELSFELPTQNRDEEATALVGREGGRAQGQLSHWSLDLFFLDL